MVSLEVNTAAVVEQKKILEKALSTNPQTQKALQQLINQVLTEIRPQVVAATKNAIGNDPREAARGIRRIVYKKILGGNLNILNMKRKAGAPTSYEPPRKLDSNPNQRGGNRVVRSKRTDEVMHYGPHDRGWILRILNSGTSGRTAGTRNGRLSGNRGFISPRNFFGSAATPPLQRAAARLGALIDKELDNMLKELSKS